MADYDVVPTHEDLLHQQPCDSLTLCHFQDVASGAQSCPEMLFVRRAWSRLSASSRRFRGSVVWAACSRRSRSQCGMRSLYLVGPYSTLCM